MVENFVDKLTSISQQAFYLLSNENSDIRNALEQVVVCEKEYNDRVGAPECESKFSEFNNLKRH